MTPILRKALPDNYRAAFLAVLILLSFKGYDQTYNPTTGTVSNKPYSPAQNVPTDSRSMYYDATNFLWRSYQSPSEVLAYLNLSKYRTGNFIIVVDSGGSLQSNGTYIGGSNTFYMFKDGTADANLVKLNLLGSTGACSGCLLASNNLSDLSSASSGRANLGLGSMSVLNSTAGGDLSGTWPSVTVSFFNGQLPSYYLNYLNLTNKPAIPAQLNPTGAGLTTITGVYPNLTWTTTTPGLDAVLLSNNALAANRTINNGSFALRITGTGAFGLPNGNTSQRPATPSLGDEFYNTDTLTAEYWNGSAWTHPSGSGGGGGSGITALTGDVSASGTGSVVATLATVNSNVFASNTFLKFGVNGKGLVTSATAVVSSDIISALGYTPYNSTNPSGYISLTALSMTNTGVNGVATYTNTTGIFNVPNYGADTTGANGLATLYQLSLKQGVVTLTTVGTGAPTLVSNTLNIPPSTLTYTQNALNNTLANNAANTATFLVADHSHAGLMDSASKAVVDSLRLRTYTFPLTVINANQGLSVDTSLTSIKLGGFFYKNDTIDFLHYDFYTPHENDKSTLLATDSLEGVAIDGRHFKFPQSAISGGGAVSSVSNSDGSLTISPTTGAVVASLNVANANTWITVPQTFNGGLALGSNVTFAATNTYNIGTLANEASQVYTANVSANGGLALSAGSSNTITMAFNGTPQAVLGHAGQLKLNSYTTTTSFTGTPVGVIEFDASGNLLTAALGTNTIAITGTSGGAQSSSAFTFSTTTNTANTALTIPGSSNIFTFTYNPAWDFGDNSRSSGPNYFWGTSIGNTSLSGVRNIAVGTLSLQSVTSGSNNIAMGVDGDLSVTTASDDIAIGYLSLTQDATGGENVGIGGQALRNNTATQITAVGYQAGAANTSGTSNAYFGFQAGFSNTTGLGNTYIGDQAGKNATTGQHSTAVGWLSLTTMTTGQENTGVGFGAGSGLTDGSFNTILGFGMDFGIHNSWNVSIGYKNYALDTAGNGNVVIGNYAASANLGVNSSVIIGDSTIGSTFPVGIGSATRSQNKTILIGAYIGVVNTPANMAHYDSSVIIGYGNKMAESSTDTAGYNLVMIGFGDTTSRRDVIILGDKNNQLLNFSYGGGYTTAQQNALATRVGDLIWNTDTVGFTYSDGTNWHKFGTGGGGGGDAITSPNSTLNVGGTSSATTLDLNLGHTNIWTVTQTFNTDITVNGLTIGKGNNSNANNTVVGVSAGAAFHTTGTNNVALGTNALAADTSGAFDMAIGGFALQNVLSGSSLVAIGYQSGQLATTATNSIFIGTQAGAQVTTASANTLIGYQAGNAITTSANNTLIGDLAGLKINSPQNTAIGVGAIENATTGVGKNTAIGYTTGLTLTTGSANVLIGFNVDVPSATSVGYVSVANLFFGQGASATGGSGYQSGTVGLGTPATTTSMVTVGITAYNSSLGTQLVTSSATSNDPVTSASGTVSQMAANVMGIPTFTATHTSVTYTTAATLWINGPPTAGTNVTIGNDYAEYILAGNIGGSTTSNAIFDHFISNGALPTPAGGGGAGSGATLSNSGTDQSGTVTINTGSGPLASTTVFTITYASSFAFPNGSYVVLQPSNTNSAALSGTAQVFALGTTTGFTVTVGSTALAASTTYIWTYHVFGN